MCNTNILGNIFTHSRSDLLTQRQLSFLTTRGRQLENVPSTSFLVAVYLRVQKRGYSMFIAVTWSGVKIFVLT